MNKLIDEKDASWSSWKIYVIKSLETHQSSISKLEDDFHKCKESHEKDIIEMKTKIGVWSIIISFITSFIITVISGIIIYNHTYDNINSNYKKNSHYDYEDLQYNTSNKLENK